MENITKLLDEVKAAKGVESKYALAKVLDLPTQRISEYYNGKSAPDEFACLKIAEALGKPLNTIIATVRASTEKDASRREAWENYMKSLGGIAASFLGGVVFTLIFSSEKLMELALLSPWHTVKNGNRVMKPAGR